MCLTDKQNTEAEPLNDVETRFTDVDKGYWAFGDIMTAVLGTEK
ncbi:hypothetical protein [Acetivibrio straminisolvens]|nr:hypothetical protein [Acetivibrio straminisolvens]